MTTRVNSDSSSANQQVYSTVSTVLVSLMMACVAVTVVLFGGKFLSDWHATYLSVFGILVALERITTFKRAKGLMVFSKSWFIFQLTHWVFILIVLKIVLLIAKRPDSLWLEIQLWQLDFFTYFFGLTPDLFPMGTLGNLETMIFSKFCVSQVSP